VTPLNPGGCTTRAAQSSGVGAFNSCHRLRGQEVGGGGRSASNFSAGRSRSKRYDPGQARKPVQNSEPDLSKDCTRKEWQKRNKTTALTTNLRCLRAACVRIAATSSTSQRRSACNRSDHAQSQAARLLLSAKLSKRHQSQPNGQTCRQGPYSVGFRSAGLCKNVDWVWTANDGAVLQPQRL